MIKQFHGCFFWLGLLVHVPLPSLRAVSAAGYDWLIEWHDQHYREKTSIHEIIVKLEACAKTACGLSAHLCLVHPSVCGGRTNYCKTQGKCDIQITTVYFLLVSQGNHLSISLIGKINSWVRRVPTTQVGI